MAENSAENPYRIVIWGPGEVGGAVTRAAVADSGFKVVGAKVHHDAKHGRDIGELVGIDAIGVTATTDRDEILALDADCVILTPAPAAVLAGLDDDVVALLESGKNVVATAAYHNVSMTNWLSPMRAAPERLLQACQTGGTTLHGTGVHPTFIAERLAMTLAQAMTTVSHVRTVEAVDFSHAPGNMWGGLAALGFGTPLDQLNADHLVARGGDIYYGDLIGNVGHALYGIDNSEIRVQTELHGHASSTDIIIGGTEFQLGTTTALHLIHRGYHGDHHFFTNEECWYLGKDAVFRGEHLPFGGFTADICYTVELTGEPAPLRTQMEFGPTTGRTNPITTASVRAVLDAVPAVCAAEPGILIDDARPRYRPDDRLTPLA